METRDVRADLRVSVTALANELRSLGNSPSSIGTYTRLVPGYPLSGFWAAPFTVTDQNSDGVIVPAEVVSSGEARYIGSPIPTREVGVAPSVTVRGGITVAALIDYRGGFRVRNAGGQLTCNEVCAPLWVPNATLAEQARAVNGGAALAAWLEDGTFLKLRELAASWILPTVLTKRLGARSAQLVIAGRNLFTKTDYTGLEPEGSFTGQSTIEATDLFVLPLPRVVSVRLNIGW